MYVEYRPSTVTFNSLNLNWILVIYIFQLEAKILFPFLRKTYERRSMKSAFEVYMEEEFKKLKNMHCGEILTAK